MAFAANQGTLFLGEAFTTISRSKLFPSPLNFLPVAAQSSSVGYL
jgi:hypothetical protein